MTLRERAHALAGLRFDGWCSWVSSDIHGENCDAILAALVEVRREAFNECERTSRLNARHWDNGHDESVGLHIADAIRAARDRDGAE